jgi:ABC-type sulfate/molybdate transport systems ATPase subunit
LIDINQKRADQFCVAAKFERERVQESKQELALFGEAGGNALLLRVIASRDRFKEGEMFLSGESTLKRRAGESDIEEMTIV